MQTMSAECVTQVHYLFLENPDMQKTVKALAIALCELASMDYSGESTRLLLDAGARVNKPSDGATLQSCCSPRALTHSGGGGGGGADWNRGKAALWGERTRTTRARACVRAFHSANSFRWRFCPVFVPPSASS